MFGGPLWKRSPAGLRAWKKRYFVLDPKDGKLLYLDSADAPSKPEDAIGSPKIRGMYKLKDVVKVKWLKDEKNGCRFDVILRAKKIKVSKSGEPGMLDVEVSKSAEAPTVVASEKSKTKLLNVIQLLAESRSLAKQWTRNIVSVLTKLKSKPGAVKQTTMKSVAEAVSSVSPAASSDDLASSIATKRRMTAEILKTHWDFTPKTTSSLPSSPRAGSAPLNIAEGGAPEVSATLDDGESRDLVHAVAQLLLCNRATMQAFSSDKAQREESEETKKTDPDAEDIDDPDGLLNKDDGVSGDELDCMSSREFASKILSSGSSGEDSTLMSPLGSATSFIFDRDVAAADLTLTKNEFTYYLYQDQTRSFFALESLAYIMRDTDHGVFGPGEFGSKVKSAYGAVAGETLTAWLMEMGFVNTSKRAEYILQTMMDLKLLVPLSESTKQYSNKVMLTLSADLLPWEEECRIRTAVCSKKYLSFLNSISDLDLINLLLENSSMDTTEMSKVEVTEEPSSGPIAGARYSPPPSDFRKVLTPSPFEGNLSRFLMDVSVKFLEKILHYGFEKDSGKTDDGLTLVLCWKILQRKISKEHFCADQTKCEICFELETEFNTLCEIAMTSERFSEHTKNALYKLMFGLDWTVEKVSISAFSQVVITPVPWRCMLRNLHRIDNDALVVEILKDTSCLFERRENVLCFQSSTTWMHCFQKTLSSYYSRLGTASPWSESVLGYCMNSLCLLHFQNFVASTTFSDSLALCCNSLKAVETFGALIPLDLKLLSVLCNFLASRRKVSGFVVSFTTTAGFNLQRIVSFINEKAFTSRLSHSTFFTRKISVEADDDVKEESQSPLSPKSSQKSWISRGRISSASPSHSASASASASVSITRERSTSRDTDDFFDNEEVLAVLLDIYSKMGEIYRALSLNVKSASSFSSDEEKKFFATLYEKFEVVDNGEKLLLLLLKAKKVIKKGKARVIVKKFFSKSSQEQKLKVIQHYVEKYSIA